MKCNYDKCNKTSETHSGKFVDDIWVKYWTCDECEADYQEWEKQSDLALEYHKEFLDLAQRYGADTRES